MPAAPIIAAIGTAVAIGGTIASVSAQNKAAKATRRASQYQKNIDNLRAARERVSAIRAARLSLAGASQASANQGALDTSASLGGLGSIQSQLSSNLSFLDRTNTLSDQAGVQLGRAAKFGQKAQTAAAIAGVGEKIFASSGDIAGVFSPKPKG